MAVEITEMSYEQGGPKKSAPQDKGTPKKSAPQKGKLLSSMKKKYLNGVEVMDTELRENVPVSQVRKEGAEFVRAMDKSRIMSERLKAEKEKAELNGGDIGQKYKSYEKEIKVLKAPLKAAISPRLDFSPKEKRKAKPGHINE